ncbi:MAG: cytochrome c-type biogenesis protein CcmH [Deinococcales bacterium]|nr:cytochrome c-type biogenesis protein CcmH [Deinococcales bacterium]
MRRFVPLLLLLLAGLALAQQVQLEARVFEIARQLRCPSCVSESVADSNSPISQQMRVLIQEQLEQGRSEEEIFAYFQGRYGDWIMLDPPKRGIHLVAWLLPVIVAVLALATVALLVRRWLANSRKPIEATPEELERVRRQLGAAGAQPDPAPGTDGDI